MRKQKAPDAVEWPKITLDGVEYAVKMSTRAGLTMEREGIVFEVGTKQPIEQSLKMLSIMIEEKKFTVDELADLIPYAELPGSFKLIGEAYIKARRQAPELIPQ